MTAMFLFGLLVNRASNMVQFLGDPSYCLNMIVTMDGLRMNAFQVVTKSGLEGTNILLT